MRQAIAARVHEPSAGTLLAAALGCLAFIVLFQVGSGLTFFADEWNLILRPDWSPDSLFAPLNEHIAVGPVVAYKLLLSAFGMESTAPLRVLNILLLLAVCALALSFVRARLGDALALLVTAVLVLLGAAWEDLLWPAAGVGFLGAMAAGLGAFLALGRPGRRADVVACGLLVVSLAFTSLGMVFAIGAAVDVALRERRLQRAFIPLVPILLYLLWYAAYGHEAQSAASWENLLGAPLYVWNAASAALASLVGLTGIGDRVLGVNPEYGRPLLAIALVGLVWAVARKPALLSRQLWVLSASALAFWAAAAVNEMPGREPGASRYQLIGAVFVVLIAAEVLRGRRLSRGWLAAAAAVAAAAILSNIGALRHGEDFLDDRAETTRAALAVIERARPYVDVDFVFDATVPGTPFPQAVRAGDYYAAVDRWGSPVADPMAAVDQTAATRRSADGLSAALLGLSLKVSTGPRPHHCALVEPDPGTGVASTRLPIAGAVLSTPSGMGDVRLRRWSESDYPVDLGPAPGTAVELAIRGHAFPQRWTAAIAAEGALEVCPLGAT